MLKWSVEPKGKPNQPPLFIQVARKYFRFYDISKTSRIGLHRTSDGIFTLDNRKSQDTYGVQYNVETQGQSNISAERERSSMKTKANSEEGLNLRGFSFVKTNI